MQEPDLIIEVEGGVVSAVCTDLALHVVVNDHDAGVEAGAVMVLPLTPGKEAHRSSIRKKLERFARGWVDVARTPWGREWLLWIGPLIRARVVTTGDTDRYCASAEAVGYLGRVRQLAGRAEVVRAGDRRPARRDPGKAQIKPHTGGVQPVVRKETFMTQTAQKPISLTLESMLAKFKESFPNLVAPFEKIKPDLERGEGAQALANLIGCEVESQDEQGLNLYRWEGRSGVFEMRVPKPFDPNPQRHVETQQQAQVQVQSEEPSTPQEAPGDATEASDRPEAEGDTQLPPEESSPNAGAADKPEPARENIPVAAGVFSALAELIGESTLLMTLCKHGDDLTVTVTPFGDDKESNVQSIAVTATAAELDEGFVQAIRVKTEGRKALAEQIEALKAAEKELVDAKKAETDAKTKEADKRKKAADDKKKEDEKKAKEAEEKKKAEAEAAKKAGEQASIF